MEPGNGSGLGSAAAALLRSPRLRAAASYPFRLGPADSDWKDRPFYGLSVVHNLSGAGDALVTVALAGSVFVSVSLNAARTRTALGLICTVLPFAVVGPLIGPAIDRLRGGRRGIVFRAAIGRLAACLLMASWIHSLLLFPAAFLSLVCSKTHAVAKAALVPGVVEHEDDLVRANSRLAVGGSLITSIAAGIGGAIYKLFGSRALLDVDVLLFATCAGLVLYMLRGTREPAASSLMEDAAASTSASGPPVAGSPSPVWPPGAPEPGCVPDTTVSAPAVQAHRPAVGRWARRRGGPSPFVPRSLRLAQIAMAGMRAASGFLTLLLIFGFRRNGAPLVWYGLVAAASIGGNFGGALLAPRLNSRIHERRLVGGAALLIASTAIAVSFISGMHRRPAAIILAGVVALGASLAKTAFDAIVQRDTLDRDRSRLFARFESIFQLVWVVGALFPTLIPIPLLMGYILTAALIVSTSAVFVAGLAKEQPYGRRAVSYPVPAPAADVPVTRPPRAR